MRNKSLLHPVKGQRPLNYRRLTLLSFSCVAALSFVIAAPVASARETLTVYSSLPLQGFQRPESADMFRGMEMALEAANHRAGRFDIRLVESDNVETDVGLPTQRSVARNARRAARSASTIAYIGEKASEPTTWSMPILNRAGILQVSPTSTAVRLTQKNGTDANVPDRYFPTGTRTFMRIVPADNVQSRAMVALMKSRKCRAVFIAHNGSPYGKGIADGVASYAKTQNLPVRSNQVLSLDAINYKPLGAQIRKSNSDCFFYGGTSEDNRAADIYDDVHSVNSSLKMFGPDGLADILFTSSLPSDIQPAITLLSPALPTSAYPPAASKFYSNFKRQFAKTPEGYAINGYEAMALILDAIRRAGPKLASKSPEARRKAVRDAAFATRNRNSIIGKYSITPTGDTTIRRYGIYGVNGGNLVYKGSLSG